MLINNKLYYRINNYLNSESSKYIANRIILNYPELIKKINAISNNSYYI